MPTWGAAAQPAADSPIGPLSAATGFANFGSEITKALSLVGDQTGSSAALRASNFPPPQFRQPSIPVSRWDCSGNGNRIQPGKSRSSSEKNGGGGIVQVKTPGPAPMQTDAKFRRPLDHALLAYHLLAPLERTRGLPSAKHSYMDTPLPEGSDAVANSGTWRHSWGKGQGRLHLRFWSVVQRSQRLPIRALQTRDMSESFSPGKLQTPVLGARSCGHQPLIHFGIRLGT